MDLWEEPHAASIFGERFVSDFAPATAFELFVPPGRVTIQSSFA
jgi:hypothetical protein